jgi:hypothetical protein
MTKAAFNTLWNSFNGDERSKTRQASAYIEDMALATFPENHVINVLVRNEHAREELQNALRQENPRLAPKSLRQVVSTAIYSDLVFARLQSVIGSNAPTFFQAQGASQSSPMTEASAWAEEYETPLSRLAEKIEDTFSAPSTLIETAASLPYDLFLKAFSSISGSGEWLKHFSQQDFYALLSLLQATTMAQAWTAMCIIIGGSFWKKLIKSYPRLATWAKENVWENMMQTYEEYDIKRKQETELSEEDMDCYLDDFGSRHGLEAQGLSDMAAVLKRVKNAPLVSKTLAMLVECFSSVVLQLDPEGHAAFIAASIKKYTAIIMGGGSSLAGLIDLASYWEQRVKIFVKTWDWKDLFEEQFDQKLLRELGESRKAISDLKYGVLIPEQVFSDARVNIARAMISKNQLVLTECKLVHEMVVSSESRLHVEREPPLGVFFTGPPGTGKTMMVSSFANMLKAILNIDNKVNVLQTHTATKHQEPVAMGLVYFLNDFFCLNDEKVEGGVIGLLQSLADTAVHKMEAASIADKEVSSVAPMFVMATTNSPFFDLSQSRSGHDKLDRRYVVVDVQVNPEKWFKIHGTKYTPDLMSAMVKEHYPGDVFTYTVGYMKNKPDAKRLDFKINEVLVICHTQAEVFAFLFRRRTAMVLQHRKLKKVCVSCQQFECKCDLVNALRDELAKMTSASYEVEKVREDPEPLLGFDLPALPRIVPREPDSEEEYIA